jgi:hypothetical protein
MLSCAGCSELRLSADAYSIVDGGELFRSCSLWIQLKRRGCPTLAQMRRWQGWDELALEISWPFYDSHVSSSKAEQQQDRNSKQLLHGAGRKEAR